MRESIIKTTGLTKKFKQTKVVDDVQLNIKKGEIYGFLGPNGAGKTTTIRMLLGLMKPTAGQIEIFGKDFQKHKIETLRKIGSLVEAPSYYEHLSGKENLEVLRKLLGVPKSRMDHVLSIVRLTKDADRKVKEYSLGMKQRLGIASAMLGDPDLLILDEPTNGLDPSGIQEIRELIQSMPDQYGMTVMLSSHLLSEMEQMATQVGIITKGKMIYQDSIEELKSKAMPQIRLRTKDTAAAKAKLLSRGYIVERKGDHLYVEEGTDQYVADMVAALVENQIPVYRIEEKKQSLEDIFLDLTKEGEEDYAPHSAS
ncbi:ATP-binding cassette domain-containing protein [Halobacillus rhizosphaerae]|uniref:ABC transporter ATP-binding protein n=1 Tax=Halobacillus rhizosphaerae TaxID=3064889 RepID=UPI00398A8641